MRRPDRAPARPLTVALIAALAIAILPGGLARPAAAVSPDLVISEIYGAGGNTGATYTTDYIELYNRGAAPASLGGLSLQYASAAGAGFFGANAGQLTELPNVTVPPGGSFLVGESSGTIGAPIPVPDHTDPTPINLSGSAGKVVLATGVTTLGCNGSAAQPCTADALERIRDLVGYGAANFFEGTGPAPGLTVTTAALRASGGATDTDQNAADFTAGTPDPRTASDPAPTVMATTPASGATDVAVDAPMSVTFSEPVTVDAGAFALACPATTFTLGHASGPATTFAITFTPSMPQDSTCSLTVAAGLVHDADAADPPDGLAADIVVSFATVSPGDPCDDPFTPIPTIQGSGTSSPIALSTVTTEGVVVGDSETATQLRGFFLQDPVGDGDAATSDGVFVFEGSNADTVSVGDNVRITGTVQEFQGQTQVSVGSIVDCPTTDTVAPTDVTFPVASDALEPLEGMLVRLPQPMVVTEHFLLGRFGQVTLAAETRLQQPTAVVAPGTDAATLQADNDRRKIILDDGNNRQNVDPIVFGRGGEPLSASNTLRGGDTATDIVGVLTWTFGGDATASPNAWRVRPVNALGGGATFEADNERPGETVEVDGSVRVVGMNLLNYFDTFDGLPDTVDNCTNGVGGPATDCRGADTPAEFDRQWPKTVAAILSVDADVIGVNEIANDGYGPDSSLAHLVGKLNDATAPGTYAWIDVDAGTGQVNAAGTDAIKVGIIYRPDAVTPVGSTAALNSVVFVNGGDGAPRSRPSIAQAFETPDGARFIVDVNHLKSKGSPCDLPDQADGQANCSVVRTNAAEALAAWLASDPTGTGDDDVLIVGDLNSYAMEDPIAALEAAGFVNLVDAFVDDPYSYVFDGQWGYLDYALGSASARDQVAGVVEWHINADEPTVLDYNTNFKPPVQLTTLYAPDRFRVSDHDPIVVGLDAASDRPTVDAGGPYEVEEGGTTSLAATGSDPTGDTVTYAWDLDGDGTFESAGQSVTFVAGALRAPQTVTVTVRITDANGQSSTDTAEIRVIWDFGGFGSPANPTGVTEARAGSALPLKFSLDGDQGPAILDGTPRFQRHACPTGAAIGGSIPIATNGPLTYTASTDTYQLTWKTQKAWAGWCGTLLLVLADGETHPLEVRFKP